MPQKAWSAKRERQYAQPLPLAVATLLVDEDRLPLKSLR